VEVYREEAGGWLGIRPPKGSFSLVSERELTSRKGDVGEINEEDVASRIGSQLSDKRNAVQVRLKRGEAVEILGQQSIDEETWYKIAPPAGEFRWIHAAGVERQGPISEDVPRTGDTDGVVPTSATNESDAAKTDSSAAPADTPNTSPPPASGETCRASSAPVPAAAPAPEVVPPPLAPTTAPTAPTPAASSTPARMPAQPSAGAAALPAAPAEFDLARQLTDIELRLSRMASAPPQLWNTERMQRDAEQLLAQAKTDAERNAVKVTMGKIDRFNMLARRYQQRGQVVSRQPSAVSQTVAGGPLPAADGRYDAVGVLRPVVSKRPGAPQFALVDERGHVVSFVTPTPDVNLQPYLGRRVGIAGNRGFIPEFNRSHVTAGRVTPLVR
jgi:hypothetical protein